MGWDTFGGLLQLIGILVVGYGVAELRHELDPAHGPIAWIRQRHDNLHTAATHLRDQLNRILKAIQRWIANLWRRITGRSPIQLASGAGLALAGSSSGTVRGTAATSPPWNSLTSNEKSKTSTGASSAIRNAWAASNNDNARTAKNSNKPGEVWRNSMSAASLGKPGASN